MDCSVQDTRHEGIKLVQTTDFFYPLVEDPYLQGKVACANVLSDLYAFGVPDCDNMLMLLAASKNMRPEHRDIVTKEMIRGFTDLATEAGTEVTGGQTVLNPWPMIGGVATAVVKEGEYIMPTQAKAGNVLLLTKPLGTQLAVNMREWILLDDKARTAGDFDESKSKFGKVEDVITRAQALSAYQRAEKAMCRLNKIGARMMQKYKSLGATDVTGFGILGHANNLAGNQTEKVQFKIHTLPVLRGTYAADKKLGNMFRLGEGYSAETSGGLLMILKDRATALKVAAELLELEGEQAWIVGDVVEGDRTAVIADDVQIIDV